MEKHVKIYMKHFDYGEQDFIPCENCGTKSVDVHHINGRGKGKDVINNLMALCRECHMLAHGEVLSKKALEFKHQSFLNKKEIPF